MINKELTPLRQQVLHEAAMTVGKTTVLEDAKTLRIGYLTTLISGLISISLQKEKGWGSYEDRTFKHLDKLEEHVSFEGAQIINALILLHSEFDRIDEIESFIFERLSVQQNKINKWYLSEDNVSEAYTVSEGDEYELDDDIIQVLHPEIVNTSDGKQMISIEVFSPFHQTGTLECYSVAYIYEGGSQIAIGDQKILLEDHDRKTPHQIEITLDKSVPHALDFEVSIGIREHNTSKVRQIVLPKKAFALSNEK